MGKMEDTYIFKYLQLLLYCWAGFGLPTRPSLCARAGRRAPKRADIRRRQPFPHQEKNKAKKNKPDLKNLRSREDFKLNLRVS